MLVNVGLIGKESLTGLDFDSSSPYTYCRICGEAFQTDRDRNPHNYATPSTPVNQVMLDNMLRRREWSHKHAHTHSEREHQNLARSGFHLTPEALVRLAPLGIVPVMDMVFSGEHSHAGLIAPRAPSDDVEGGS